MQQPVLSIGIIFKNNVRSLERCLKALQPLRDAIPCELVMADTGSDDGSREIAERYADILFEFPWIDDFSAARNAVIDRSSGEWHFVVDSDEYLDENITELVEFLRRDGKKQKNEDAPSVGCITVRNYTTYDMNGPGADFLGFRLVRISSGYRFEGVIHERLNYNGEKVHAEPLMGTVLHHDGYVGLDGEAGKEKRERNIRLLRKQLEEDPDDLLALMQFVESGITEPDYEDKIRHSVKLVLEGRFHGWSRVAPVVLRDAIRAANRGGFPETAEWIQKAEELFPQSAFTRIDVNYVAAVRCIDGKDNRGTISRGQQYLKALRDFRSGALDPTARLYGILSYDSDQTEQDMRYCLANAYALENDGLRALELMERLDYTCLDAEHTRAAVQALRNLHFSSGIDTAKAVMTMWKGVTEPKPSAENAEARKKAVLDACAGLFSNDFRAKEKQDKGFCRPSYTMLAPLKEFCDLGKAAVLMESTNPAEMERLLNEMEDWMGIPRAVLLHALDQGMPFPLSAHPLKLEEMDTLAVSLVKEGNDHVLLVIRTAERADTDNWQGFVWAHELSLAAVQVWPWEHLGENGEQGLALAKAFAKLEREFLDRCYTAEALREDRLFALPPVHRFGWYCAQAFAALDGGDLLVCVRQLRAGLSAHEGMKEMVEFLLKRIEEMERASRIAEAPPELVELAERVKLMLARFAPDDPAVAELKKSPAYQQVAWMIEEPTSFWERLPQ